MRTDLPDHELLKKSHPPALVDELMIQLQQGGNVVIEAAKLTANTRATEAQALALLRDVEKGGWLREGTLYRCPCGEPLTAEQAAGGVCLQDPAATFDPKQAEHLMFWCERPVCDFIPWLLLLHGMNTTGVWQGRFHWILSCSYGRMIPVAPYKYGNVKVGAFIPWLQRRHMHRLVKQIGELARDAKDGGFGERPDVIAHSFGTWLLGHALRENPGLKVGKVILLGSILRTDFDWSELKERGQVEAVLNHYGTRDIWAWVARYAIPDSGPSGFQGFDDSWVINVPAVGFTHSQFFEEKGDVMKELFRTEPVNGRKGLWHEFLTCPEEELPSLLDQRHQPRWEALPPPLPVGHTR
ncbi:MAG TPA: hypothetical protein VF789_11805 [Thermoanaerobaculia bacterium]